MFEKELIVLFDTDRNIRAQFLNLGRGVPTLRAENKEFWDFWYRTNFKGARGVKLLWEHDDYLYASGDYIDEINMQRKLSMYPHIQYKDLRHNLDGSLSLNMEVKDLI